MTERSAEAAAPGGIGGHLPQLDGLRGVAVLLVLWGHLLPGRFRADLHLGTWGVQLFFVLSGFLITRILLGCRRDVSAGRTTSGVALRAFYGRRFLRIFPFYYTVLVAYAVAWPDHPGKENLVWLFVYAQNWLAAAGVPGPETLGHFWSLAVEEQFYVVWPALALGLPVAGVRAVALAVVAASTVCVVLAPGEPLSWAFAAFGALALGCLLSLSPGPWVAVAGAAGVLLLVAQASAPAASPIEALARQWGAPLASVGLVAWASLRPAALAWALEPAPVRYLGRISYGVYALHMPVIVVLQRGGLVPHGELGAAAVGLAVTLGLAAVSWHVLEAPLLALRSRLPYAPAPVKARPAAQFPLR